MTRFPIKLEDKHTRQGRQRGQLVEASVCLDVSASLIADSVARWKTLWVAGLERRRGLGVPAVENEHWDWLANRVGLVWPPIAAWASNARA